MFRSVLILGIFFLKLSGICYAQPVVIINKAKENINIGRQIAVMQDFSGKLSFEQASSLGFENKFAVNTEMIPNFGSSRLPVWCRFTIKNYTDQKLILVIDNSQLEWIDLFTKDDTAGSHRSISAYTSFNRREILLNKCFFALNVPKDSTRVYYLKVQTVTGLQFPLTVSTMSALIENEQPRAILYGIYIGIMIIMILYNLFIYVSTRDRSYIWYVLYVFFMMLTNVTDKGLSFQFLWPSYPALNHYITIIGCLTGIFAILFAMSFLHIQRYSRRLTYLFYGIIGSYFVSMTIILLRERFIGLILSESLTIIATLTLLSAGIIVYRKGYKPALYYLLAWTFLLACVVIFLLEDLNVVPYNNFTVNGLTIGSAIETLLLSIALANRINVYKKEKEKAQSEVLLYLENNRKLITEQNISLEKKVEERTLELQQSNKELTATLQNLKLAQTQLIHSEKMASLGELTAGIAHEIENPLNFINNFSEINTELIAEMKDEIDKGNMQEAKAIAKNITDNELKINHHGKRADAIVKGMLMHSRGGNGVKEPTQLNHFVNEYLRVSYYGMRAKDKTYDITMHTNFDESIEKVDMIRQDFGMVLLNIFTNAFYSVKEKITLTHPIVAGSATTPGVQDPYQPTVSVSTTKVNLKPGGSRIEIRVEDNGMGISQKILDKIFQPFFTTKPTGQGTGLGLSLSYDIIKAHGGEIKVVTKEGESALFTIIIPAT